MWPSLHLLKESLMENFIFSLNEIKYNLIKHKRLDDAWFYTNSVWKYPQQKPSPYRNQSTETAAPCELAGRSPNGTNPPDKKPRTGYKYKLFLKNSLVYNNIYDNKYNLFRNTSQQNPVSNKNQSTNTERK